MIGLLALGIIAGFLLLVVAPLLMLGLLTGRRDDA